VEQDSGRETFSTLGRFTIGIVLPGIGQQPGHLLVASAKDFGADPFALAVDLFGGRCHVNDVTVASFTSSCLIITMAVKTPC